MWPDYHWFKPESGQQRGVYYINVPSRYFCSLNRGLTMNLNVKRSNAAWTRRLVVLCELCGKALSRQNRPVMVKTHQQFVEKAAERCCCCCYNRGRGFCGGSWKPENTSNSAAAGGATGTGFITSHQLLFVIVDETARGGKRAQCCYIFKVHSARNTRNNKAGLRSALTLLNETATRQSNLQTHQLTRAPLCIHQQSGSPAGSWGRWIAKCFQCPGCWSVNTERSVQMRFRCPHLQPLKFR